MPEKLDIEYLYKDAVKQISVLEEKLKRGDELVRIGVLESHISELEAKIERMKNHIMDIESKIKIKNKNLEKLRLKNHELASGITLDQRLKNAGKLIGKKNKEISRLRRENANLVNKLITK